MLFKLPPQAPRVTIRFEGRELEVPAGAPLAAGLLAHGVDAFRATPVSGVPRAPYCMMGTCFECLVEIDGVGNRQACLASAREGMCVRMQRGARALAGESRT